MYKSTCIVSLCASLGKVIHKISQQYLNQLVTIPYSRTRLPIPNYIVPAWPSLSKGKTNKPFAELGPTLSPYLTPRPGLGLGYTYLLGRYSYLLILSLYDSVRDNSRHRHRMHCINRSRSLGHLDLTL